MTRFRTQLTLSILLLGCFFLTEVSRIHDNDTLQHADRTGKSLQSPYAGALPAILFGRKAKESRSAGSDPFGLCGVPVDSSAFINAGAEDSSCADVCVRMIFSRSLRYLNLRL